MKKVSTLTVEQMRELDRRAMEDFGIPSVVLMENAGAAVAREVKRIRRRKKDFRVTVVCGSGNNGGDGFVAIRHLINAGVRVDGFLVGKSENLKNDARINFSVLNRMGYFPAEINWATDALLASLKAADVVVDAIFGYGLNRPVAEPFQSIIDEMNKKARKIVAVDIPSGLEGNTGKALGVCVKAQITVTFDSVKVGMRTSTGRQCCGKIVVEDIGIPRVLKDVVVGH